MLRDVVRMDGVFFGGAFPATLQFLATGVGRGMDWK